MAEGTSEGSAARAPGAGLDSAAAAPDDADDLRGFYFRLLLGKPLTWLLLGLEVLTVGVLAAVFLGPAIGAAAAWERSCSACSSSSRSPTRARRRPSSTSTAAGAR